MNTVFTAPHLRPSRPSSQSTWILGISLPCSVSPPAERKLSGGRNSARWCMHRKSHSWPSLSISCSAPSRHTPSYLHTCAQAVPSLQKHLPLIFPATYTLFHLKGHFKPHCLYEIMFSSLLKRFLGSSHCGSAVTNPTSIHEDAGSIPGLAQRVKDAALQ